MEVKSILIVEDDFSFALELEMALTQDEQYKVHLAPSSDEALKLVEEKKVDAILLDLYLKGSLSGMDLGKIFKEKNIPVIVITSHSDEELYKLTQSFDPIAFLVKPFNRLTLISTLDRAIPKQAEVEEVVKQEILVRSNNQLHKIKFDDITHINSDGNYCVIHALNVRHAIKKSLKKLLEELPKGRFIRIHKSYVVQADLIANVDLGKKTLFVEGHEIPFGKRYKKDLINRFY